MWPDALLHAEQAPPASRGVEPRWGQKGRRAQCVAGQLAPEEFSAAGRKAVLTMCLGAHQPHWSLTFQSPPPPCHHPIKWGPPPPSFAGKGLGLPSVEVFPKRGPE